MGLIPGKIERFGFDPTRSTMQIKEWSVVGKTFEHRPEHLAKRTVNTPWIDLSARSDLRTVVDGEVAAPSSAVVVDPRSRKRLARLTEDQSQAGNVLAHASDDSGATWTEPFELPASLTGREYQAATLPNDELLITFIDTHPSSPTRGDLVGWVGTFNALVEQREGRFTCRLLKSEEEHALLANLSVQVREDGSIVVRAQGGARGRGATTVELRFTLEDMVELLPTRGFDIPLIDLNDDRGRHVVVDREEGQYLGHVTTTLLEDGKTILAVYPKGHGRGAIVYKKSTDGGLTWSKRLPTPDSWATSKEVPTIHRVVDPKTGKKRHIVWSGLYPARLAVSEDDGASWSELAAVGDWGGIVVMGFVEQMRDGSYLAMFHDDGRFFTDTNKRTSPPLFTMYKTFSHDGGLTWSYPEEVWSGRDIHLCEPGCFRSPDGKTLAVLLRENSRQRNGYVIFSEDEGQTWTPPRELPAALTGDRHTGKYAPDGRLFISFRDMAHDSPTWGDWVGWVGTWDDIYYGRPGQYRVRLKDNTKGADTTYPGVEVLPDGTFVVTTYGHWDVGKQPYILSARFTLDELDAKAAALPATQAIFVPGMRGAHTYRIPALVTANAGTLIAGCDSRNPSSRDLPNDIDTVIRRSTDGGKTWDDIQVVLAWQGGEGTADPCLLVDGQTGRIWCAVTWADGVSWRSSKPGYGDDSFHTLLIYSDDDGLTWSTPIDVTQDLKDPTWRSAWFSPGAGVQSSSGRLIIPYSTADGEGAMYSYAAVSDDHGETWRRVGPIGEKTNECMIARRSDDVLVCNMRSTHGLQRRAVSYSLDDGETWSPLQHHEELIERSEEH
ncbi:MAG: exo-alpha-sialidase, partial [Phycisphaerales bacterium JB038]